MKKSLLTVTIIAGLVTFGCKKQEEAAPDAPPAVAAEEVSNVPPLDPNNIASLAIASEDHTTLVAAIKAADYVTSITPGMITVFAPTNAAFEKLPEGTVDNLLKPENVEQLRKILQYHVTPSAHPLDSFTEGETMGMLRGKVTMHVKDGQVSINDANITASVSASNGVLHIIDAVLLPPES